MKNHVLTYYSLKTALKGFNNSEKIMFQTLTLESLESHYITF